MAGFASSRFARGILAAAIGVLLLASLARAGGADWDVDNEADGSEFEAPQQKVFDAKAAAEDAARANAAKAADARRRQDRWMNAPPMFEWKYEGVALVFLAAYVVTWTLGNRANATLARDWEAAFCGPDGMFAKNFAALGADGAGPSRHSLLAREGPDEYKFYASGRRFVEGVMVTLRMRSRNDLFSVVYDMMYHTADPDLCVVECFMKDECVGAGSVFAIGDKARIATLEGVADDVKRLTGVHAVKDAKGNKATAGRIVVKAESAELAKDVTTEHACDVALSEKAASSTGGANLMHIHCTDEGAGGAHRTAARPRASHKKVLRLTFKMPPPGCGKDEMEAALGDLLTLVPHYIDVVGRVQLSGAQKERAEKARLKRKEEDFKKGLKENAAEAARAKQDEKLAKMTPAEKAKWKERQEKKALKKSSRLQIMKK